jgi:outer membrane lipoprotein carrier protein
MTKMRALGAAVVLTIAAGVGCDEPSDARPAPIPSVASAPKSAVPAPSASAAAAATDTPVVAPPASGTPVLDTSAAPPDRPAPLSASVTLAPPPAPPASAPAASASAMVAASAPPPEVAPVGSGQPTAAASSSAGKSEPAPLEPAAAGSADAVAEKIDGIYKSIGRIRARFDQRYTAKVAGTTKESKGILYAERPTRLSFSYHEPNKNRVVSDGVTLKIYEHENKQMFVRAVADTEYPGALAFILGKGLRQSFSFTFHESAGYEGGPVLIGTPRVPNPAYKTIIFYIDENLLKQGDPSCIRRVLVVDAQGNRNRFDFLHIEQPASISPAEFTFEAPAGTEIIK